jgi:hypothetical protein
MVGNPRLCWAALSAVEIIKAVASLNEQQLKELESQCCSKQMRYTMGKKVL